MPGRRYGQLGIAVGLRAGLPKLRRRWVSLLSLSDSSGSADDEVDWRSRRAWSVSRHTPGVNGTVRASPLLLLRQS